MTEYHITHVLNPAIGDENLAETSPGKLPKMFEDEDLEDLMRQKYPTHGVQYDQETEIAGEQFGELRFDTDAGFGQVSDVNYGQRNLFAMAYAAEDEDEFPVHGIFVTGDYGLYTHISDLEQEYSGIEPEVMDGIREIIDACWDYGEKEELSDIDAILAEAPYDVDLVPKVQKFRDKLDGSREKDFDSTLRKLATAPIEQAYTRVTDRDVKHTVDGDYRVMAEVDTNRKRVEVYFVGDHEEFDRKDIEASVQRGRRSSGSSSS